MQALVGGGNFALQCNYFGLLELLQAAPCALCPAPCTGNSNLTRSDCLTEVGNPGHPLASLLEKG